MKRALTHKDLNQIFQETGLQTTGQHRYLAGTAPGVFINALRHARGGWTLMNAREHAHATKIAWVRDAAAARQFIVGVTQAAVA